MSGPQVGLVYRGEVGDTKIRTSLGGNQVAVGILFGGWADSLDVYTDWLESLPEVRTIVSYVGP